MDRLIEIETELEALARRRPMFPRSWASEIARRVAETGFDIEDVVLEMREERNLVAPGPATPAALIEHEKRFLALFEPDELLPEVSAALARSSAD